MLKLAKPEFCYQDSLESLSSQTWRVEDEHPFVPAVGDVDVVVLIRAHSPRAAQLVIYGTDEKVSVVDPELAMQEDPFSISWVFF